MNSSIDSMNLGALAVPESCHDPINIESEDPAHLIAFLKSMYVIRLAEKRLALGRKVEDVGGPVHLGVGQEAIAVGVSHALRKTDRVFGAHRSHSHLLALNPDFYKLFAEVLGKTTGFSRGMGGSMHLWDQPNGFYGSVPIVAGTVSLAVGAGMAAKLQNTSDLAVTYFGDGAIEEGVVHESLNLAKIQNAPVLFVGENNLFASHMHISLRQPGDQMARFARANNIPYEVVDGNDVVTVSRVAKKMAADIRKGKGPRFLEAVTYRWYGHVDWRDDIDVGVNRSLEDVENWRARDPVKRLSDALILHGNWSEAEEQDWLNQLQREIDQSWDRAMNDPYPTHSKIMDYVLK